MKYSKLGSLLGNGHVDKFCDFPELEELLDENNCAIVFKDKDSYDNDVKEFITLSRNINKLLFRIPANFIDIDEKIVSKIEKRVYQRVAYYHYFHGYEIDQLKQAANRVYWILKYKPFKFIDGIEAEHYLNDNVYDINVSFAFYFLWWSVVFCANERIRLGELKIKKGMKCFPFTGYKPEALLTLYLHTFSECDCSKEILMPIAETLYHSLITPAIT